MLVHCRNGNFDDAEEKRRTDKVMSFINDSGIEYSGKVEGLALAPSTIDSYAQ